MMILGQGVSSYTVVTRTYLVVSFYVVVPACAGEKREVREET